MSTLVKGRKAQKLSLAPGTELVVRAKHGGVIVVIEGDGELELTRSPSSAPPAKGRSLRPRDLRLERALAAMRAEPGRRFTSKALAKIAGASQSTLVRLFARHLGTTPKAWLAGERLELARRLLTETNAGLAEIASRTDYASEFGLSRAFKRHFGVAPSVLRRATYSVAAPVRCAA
jgi:transcriptional regulator GlxA family with amidase domain